jgi:hypothetical protein
MIAQGEHVAMTGAAAIPAAGPIPAGRLLVGIVGSIGIPTGPGVQALTGTGTKPPPAEPCDDPLPILWPRELPLPPDGNPPLQRKAGKGEGEWDGDERGPEQRKLQKAIKEAREKGLPPPSPCFEDDAEPNQVYEAHHMQPIYLNGKDQAFNLCALEIGRHQRGHSRLDNQSDMANRDPTWRACGQSEGRLRFHPDNQMYEYEIEK